jgi:glycosyltransferase involved in cell wall biosynthesis
MTKKRILIFFPHPHLAYSPTVLNLSRLLDRQGHRVKIVYGIEEFWGEKAPRLDGVEVEQVAYGPRTMKVVRQLNRFVWKPFSWILRKLSLFTAYANLSLRELLMARSVGRAVRSNPFDEMIAVDILPLYWSQRLGIGSHFVSLEVEDGRKLVKCIDPSRVKSVVIQSRERYERLFGSADIRTFFVQNVPNFTEPRRRTTASPNLVYNGSVWIPFGAVDLLEFVRLFPSYRMQFKGSVHPEVRKLLSTTYEPLVRTGTVRISDTYLDDAGLREYLADFSIGFCFYDFHHPDIAHRRFNYETAPSGKVFFYLSIGLPVIATRLRGFDFLEKRKAGVLIDDHSPEGIRRAVETILSEYQQYSDNALAAGREFSFDKQALPFANFIGN